jgi:2-oxo-3-hexenedioate decarboxylase
MLTPTQIAEAARLVDEAAMTASPIPMLSLSGFAEMTLADAYLIQRAAIHRRLGRGERLVGMKMGLTSLAKMQQVGVHEPIYGHLTSQMMLGDGEALDFAARCHPRVEPELCFLLARDLKGPTTPAQALEAVGGVCAALEVIDSRYRDFQFTLTDVVADNASSSAVILGPKVVDPRQIDLANLGIVLEHNGAVVHTGSSAAIYEHPARSLAALANLLAEVGEQLTAGQLVMAGAATAAVEVRPGDHVRVLIEGLGAAEVFVAAARK